MEGLAAHLNENDVRYPHSISSLAQPLWLSLVSMSVRS